MTPTRDSAAPARHRGPSPRGEFCRRMRAGRVASDPGVHWRQVGPGMAGYNEHVWVHPESPEQLIISPDMLNLYRSTDAGESWAPANDADGPGGEATRLNALAFSPSAPDHGYAVNREGLWETTDRGASWHTRPEWVCITPGDIHAVTQPTGPATSIFGGTLSAVAFDPYDDRVAFVGSGDYFNDKLNRHTRARPSGRLPAPEVYWRTNLGKVFRTTDGGTTWQLCNAGIDPLAEIGPIVVDRRDPATVYLATSKGFYRSDDRGAHWHRRVDGLPTGVIRDLSAHHDPASGRTTLVVIDQVVWEPDGRGSVSSSGGVFRSTDGGESWQDLSAGLRVNVAELFPHLADANGLVSLNMDYTPVGAAWGDDLLRSIYFRNLGRWFEMSPDDAFGLAPTPPTDMLQSFNRIAIDPSDRDRIYVMANGQHGTGIKPFEVWSTADGGDSWIVCARHGTGWSRDAAYWSAMGTPTTTNMEFGHNGPGSALLPYNQWGFSSLAVGPDGHVYLWHYQQLFRSVDHGGSWHTISERAVDGGWVSRGDANPPGRGVTFDPSDGSAYLAVGENGLWRIDPGTLLRGEVPAAQLLRWPNNEPVADQPSSAGRSISTMAIHPRDPNTLYLMCDRQDFAGEVRRSTDRGETWQAIARPLPVESHGIARCLCFDSQDPRRMYFCAPDVKPHSRVVVEEGIERGVYASPDGGRTWRVANHGLPERPDVYAIAPHPTTGGTLFAALRRTATAPGGLYRTDDSGGSWRRLALPDGADHVNGVEVVASGDGVDLYAATSDGGTGRGGLWRSTDGGRTWTCLLPLPNVAQCAVHPRHPDLLAVIVGPSASISGRNPGIAISEDAGASWRKINTGLSQPHLLYGVGFDPTRDRVIWCAAWGAGNYLATF